MSEVSNRRFVHFDGTKQEFIDGGYPDQYQESIVFINEDGNESNNTIYTHGEYYGQGVIVEGDASNSAVLKGEYDGHKNKALSPSSIAIGVGTTSGLKGYYYKALHLNTNRNVFYLYLSRTQQKPKLITSYNEITPETDIDIDLEINDVITIVNGDTFDDMFYIYGNDIKTYGRITIRSRSNDYFPFKDILTNDNIDNGIFNLDDYCIYSKHKPSAGLAPLPSQGSFAEGYFTVTRGIGSHAEGKYNKHNDFTLHSVGIGTSDTNRKNAHEITTDGKHYIYNIGDYDGTNPTNTNDLKSVIDNKTNKCTSITHDEIIKLKNKKTLIPGAYYRITDYITVNAQYEYVDDSQHPFDVIVFALSENTLAEEAYAIQSARDTDGYFANSNLDAWKLWYSLDNDTERFAWADTENGKGVIYRMIDEWNNDVPYDFKNIHTFDYGSEQGGGDFSLMGEYCHNNTIKPYYINNKQYLNRIIFFNEIGISNDVYCLYNNFGEGCHDIRIGSNCYRNSFGSEIYDCSIGDNFYINVLGDKCYNNTFGNDCAGNTLGQVCSLNSIGNEFKNNIFGNICHSNIIGDAFAHNILSNNCHHNEFGTNCTSNKFGTGCYSNKFGNYFQRNDIGSLCHNNNIKMNYVQYNTIGNGVRNCTFNCSEKGENTYQVQRYNIEPGLYSKDFQVDRGNTYTINITYRFDNSITTYTAFDIIGYNCHNNGIYSHTFGLENETNNIGEFACGKYNYTTNGTLFSVGNGTSSRDRKNIIEVRDNDILLWSEDKQGYIKMSELLKKKLINVYDKNGISLYDIHDVCSLLKGGIFMPPSDTDILYLIFHADKNRKFCIPIYPNSRNAYVECRFYTYGDDEIFINIIETHDYVMLSDYTQNKITNVELSYEIDSSCENVFEIIEGNRLVFSEEHEYITEQTIDFSFSNIGEFGYTYTGTVIDSKYACCTKSGSDYTYPYNCIIRDEQFMFNTYNKLMRGYIGVIIFKKYYSSDTITFAPAEEALPYVEGYTLDFDLLYPVRIKYDEDGVYIGKGLNTDLHVKVINYDDIWLIDYCKNVKSFDTDIHNIKQITIRNSNEAFVYNGSVSSDDIIQLNSTTTSKTIDAWVLSYKRIVIISDFSSDWDLNIFTN